MFRSDIGDDTAVRYLLGQLPDAERDDFEDRYFSCDALHEQLQVVEEELIDAYVRGRLNSADRAAFEGRFLASPERRQKIEFARGLAALPIAPSPRRSWAFVLSGWIPRSPVMRLSFAGIAAAIVVGILFMLRFWQGTPAPPLVAKVPPQVQPVQEQPTGGNDGPIKIPQPSPNLRALGPRQGTSPLSAGPKVPPKLPAILAFALAPGVRGEGGSNRISIPPGTYRIRLNLSLTADAVFPQYAATVSTIEGQEVWHERNLRTNGQTVALTIPSTLLPAGDYAIKLTGIAGDGAAEDVAGYTFGVAEK